MPFAIKLAERGRRGLPVERATDAVQHGPGPAERSRLSRRDRGLDRGLDRGMDRDGYEMDW
jgi:hypothetical protein